MITLITGVPGSGKTYLAVKTLVENHFVDKKGLYRQKDPQTTIFTNINGLKLEHKDLNEIFKTVPFDQFFSKDYQDKIHQKYQKVIYVLDECQQFIPPRYSNTNVILYFDTHRHYSDQVFLITQDEKKICKGISSLAEMEYRAVRSTFSLFGEFKYNIKSGGEIFKREVSTKNKRIFKLYQSFQGEGQDIKKSRLGLYVIICLIAFIGLAYYFFFGVSKIGQTNNPRKNNNNFTSQPLQNNQTSFPLDPPPDEHDPFVSKSIQEFVATSSGLYAFCDPVTNNWYFNPKEFPNYQIIKHKHFYYFIIPQSYIEKHTSEKSLSMNPIKSPSHHIPATPIQSNTPTITIPPPSIQSNTPTITIPPTIRSIPMK